MIGRNAIAPMRFSFHALNCCPLYSLCGMLAIRAAVSACMPPTTARLSTYMLQSCCHSNLVNLGALAKRTVIQPAFHRWLSVRMLYIIPLSWPRRAVHLLNNEPHNEGTAHCESSLFNNEGICLREQ